MSFQTCMSFFLMLNTKEDILKNSFKNQKVVGLHWLPYLITSILQSIFFYGQPKKETHTGLERHEGE